MFIVCRSYIRIRSSWKTGEPMSEVVSFEFRALCLTTNRELLLIEGIALQGLGNWQAVSEHVGTRTKEQVEEHYYNVYINSPHWPLPVSRS